MGNFCTLNSMVILILPEIASIISYTTIYRFSIMDLSLSMTNASISTINTTTNIFKMTQNNILWDSQQYLNLVKAIICHSGTKIENDYRIFNFITNFVPLSYSTLISFNSHKNGIIAQAKSPNINPMLLLLCIYTIYIGSSYNIWSEISVLFAEFVVQNRGINY
eukprot:466262_1